MMNNFSASIYSEDGSISDSLETNRIGEVIDFVWDKLQQGYSAVVKNLGINPAEEIELGPEYADDQDKFEEDMLRFSRIGQGGDDWDWDEQYADSYYESLNEWYDDDYDDEDDEDDDYYEDEDKYSLVGVDGNAYSIMGYTANALKREGLRNLVSQMHAEATSGDYDNLIAVCFKYVEMANEAARGDYDDIQESLKNTKINIRESLNKIDLRTGNKYDLRNLYDSCILNDKEKRTIAEMIAKNTKANVLYEALMNKFKGKELKESKSDNVLLSDIRTIFRNVPKDLWVVNERNGEIILAVENGIHRYWYAMKDLFRQFDCEERGEDALHRSTYFIKGKKDLGKEESLKEGYIKCDPYEYPDLRRMVDELGFSSCVRYGEGFDQGKIFSDDATLRQIQREISNEYGYDYDIVYNESLKESDDKSEKTVIYKELGKFRATPESNYNSRIRNERKIQKLDDFDSADEIMDYYIKYGWADSKDDFKVIDSTNESIEDSLKDQCEVILKQMRRKIKSISGAIGNFQKKYDELMGSATKDEDYSRLVNDLTKFKLGMDKVELGRKDENS